MHEPVKENDRHAAASESDPIGLSTAAVLVTYNRLHLLKRSLQSVLDQTLRPDVIIVVDNRSTDGTTAWLESYTRDMDGVEILLLPENKGASGGFGCGIRRAYESGADWIWTLDDDTIAEPDTLEKLMERVRPMSQATLYGVGYLCSKVVWRDGSRHVHNVPVPDRDWWEGYEVMPGSIRLSATTFVSALFNRVAIQAVGFPVEEFFIWWDDVEYTARMSDNGYWGYHVDDSWVTHLTAENKLARYSSVDKSTLWKFQYGIRNEIALLKAKEYGWARASWRMISMTLETWRNSVPAHMILSLWFWGLKGWFFNYRRFIVRPQDA